MVQSRSMEARVGRVKQRYGPDGSRLVAGVVAVSVDRRKVLVVESTNRQNHWVLPKGGYETDEARPEDAAAREAWEEAGITGRVTRALGEIRDPRPLNAVAPPKAGGQARTLYYFFEFHVEREEDRWPEMHKRKRRWMTYEEALSCFQSMNRPELIEAIDRSSVLR
ncbi:NUDIX hydrolase domain-like protein [Tricharina praecox]|uniref:NUDIX hydrolase domain-like protein n=1 Tax=Tricharina praecox TaxID=43433 RepID=UPI00221E93A3|nr:NUDIX hydrolase domain-like protein [Tricharina praecox]KAI5858462.1 NUDIX hydrolase domain-like protein [Tricharina praecox]